MPHKNAKRAQHLSKRDRAKLTPSDLERVKVIVRIFKMYVEEGKGYRSSADTLNQQGIAKTRRPQWSGETENGTDDIWWILEGRDYPRMWWKLIPEN